MPAMKLTFNAAMRARDVSRPRAEHLAEAEARYADRPQARTSDSGREARGGEKTGTPRATASGDERAGRPGFPRRRRGRGSR